MKQIMFLIVILSLVAVSFAGHYKKFEAIKTKACDTKTKLTEKQWIDLLACGKGLNETHFAKYRAITFSNCSSAGNETELQALKLSGNDQQNQAVIEMCSENFNKCRMNLFKSWKKNHKKNEKTETGDHKREDGETDGKEDHKNKHEAWKQKLKCMKTAVGITE